MRLPSTLSWFSLCLNVILLLLLLIFLVSPDCLTQTPRASTLPSDVAALGMEVYYEKGPFVLLAGKDFPREESFMLALRDRPLSISLLDTDRLGGTANTTSKTVSVGLGDDFSLSCDYSLAGGRADPSHLMLNRRNKGLLEALTDFNVDGVFDLRQTRDENRQLSRMYVWYQSTWREVMGGDKDANYDGYHKQLVDGERVSFDKHYGQWLSPTDKPIIQRPPEKNDGE